MGLFDTPVTVRDRGVERTLEKLESLLQACSSELDPESSILVDMDAIIAELKEEQILTVERQDKSESKQILGKVEKEALDKVRGVVLKWIDCGELYSLHVRNRVEWVLGVRRYSGRQWETGILGVFDETKDVDAAALLGLVERACRLILLEYNIGVMVRWFGRVDVHGRFIQGAELKPMVQAEDGNRSESDVIRSEYSWGSDWLLVMATAVRRIMIASRGMYVHEYRLVEKLTSV